MKKRISFVLLLCLLLAACSPPPSSSGASSAPPPAAPAYSEALNPYNRQTAVSDEYILAVKMDAIYRISRRDGSAQTILTSPSDKMRIAPPPSIAVYDEHIYFIYLLNINEVEETNQGPVKMSLCRADLDGNNITPVAALEGYAHYLYLYNDILIALDYSYEYGGPLQDHCRLFKPSSAAAQLEELPLESIPESETEAMIRYIGPEHTTHQLQKRLGFDNDMHPGFNPMMANDAYYFFDAEGHGEPDMFRVAYAEEEAPQAIPLPESITQEIKALGIHLYSCKLVNYDAEWLYLAYNDRIVEEHMSLITLFRIKKDGSAFEYCLETKQRGDLLHADVIGNYCIFLGQYDGTFYMGDLATGETRPLSTQAPA